MMASGSKHRRLLVNAVKHRELTAKMMLGLASISCQESVAKSALLFDTLRDLNKINYSGVLAADANDFAAFVNTSIATMKERLSNLLGMVLGDSPRTSNPQPQEPATTLQQLKNINGKPERQKTV